MKSKTVVKCFRLVSGTKLDDQHATLTLKELQKNQKRYKILQCASSQRFHYEQWQNENKYYFKVSQGTHKGFPIWNVHLHHKGKDEKTLMWKFHHMTFLKPEEANRLLLLEDL